ncbi:MAG: plasmid stabilization system [Chloroflexi bacterium]|nr:MAG: plasmid stabilization system [Chloroflexota bacterium]
MAVAYTLFVEPEVHAARRLLPGHVRQRIARLIGDFASHPRPSNSQSMEYDEEGLPVGVELRRVRLEQWRIIYAVNDDEHWVWVLAIRRRPPYDYTDLPDLVQRLQ